MSMLKNLREVRQEMTCPRCGESWLGYYVFDGSPFGEKCWQHSTGRIFQDETPVHRDHCFRCGYKHVAEDIDTLRYYLDDHPWLYTEFCMSALGVDITASRDTDKQTNDYCKNLFNVIINGELKGIVEPDEAIQRIREKVFDYSDDINSWLNEMEAF